MNKVILYGRLTKDTEVKKTQSNKSVCNFSVAVSEGKDQTTFINCQAWEKTADILGTFFSKGDRILIEGRIATYTKEAGGQKQTITYVVADRVEFVESKKKEEVAQPTTNPSTITFEQDSLPFY